MQKKITITIDVDTGDGDDYTSVYRIYNDMLKKQSCDDPCSTCPNFGKGPCFCTLCTPKIIC